MHLFRKPIAPLVILTLVGVVLRFTNLNWDMGGRIHPDEALIVNGALAIKFFSQIFPGFHDYNGFSVYLLKLFSLGVTSSEVATIIGRFLSAALSTFSILLIYLLGKRWWNKKIGMIAATFFTFTPLVIQLAHFYTTENILIFLLLVLVLSAHSPSLMAIPMGLLLATKNTAYLFLPIPLSIIMTQKNKHKALSLVFFVLLTSLIFFLASPYSFLDLPGYLSRSRYLADVVSGRLPMDWTVQFQKTNGIFWIQNLLFAIGPLSVIGLIGIIRYLLQGKERKGQPYLFAMWSLGFMIFLAITYLKFTRYLAPLIPFLSLFAARFLFDIQKTYLGKLLLYITLGLQIVYGVMFFSVYTTPHTSLAATNWIQKNIPPKSTILTEEWNSIIRFYRPELSTNAYQLTSFNFYTLPDTKEKSIQLNALLKNTDYIVIESPKVKNTITRLHADYPYSAQFYKDLESGTLGFRNVAIFSSYPRFGPLVINDVSAEETWYVFDHPKVLIYRKIQQ